ncbi:hypothetical protein ETU10_06260 [Apibacter muscae]|uniref:hypothetical protein n=1 Tax=Apibacter muscae TaxID=2509004 RepID=UPI0011AC10A3|nr:hypothetical protein [Apibacter muscae]TWP23833.1 hypothetical protein ETU10_06260 [Apibacter muscae]
MNNSILLINQLIEIKQKAEKENFYSKIERNVNRMLSIFEDEGYKIIVPLGEKYSETRTDCEANLVGKESSNMKITQVIKPIIYKQQNQGITIVQKGIVLVENK